MATAAGTATVPYDSTALTQGLVVVRGRAKVPWPAPTFGVLAAVVVLAASVPVVLAWLRRRWTKQAMSLKYEDIHVDERNPEGVLGSGGQGEVKRGTWHKGPAAVKVLLPAIVARDKLGEAWKGLVQEAATLKRLEHPNIVRVFGFCEHDTGLLVVMELCSDGSLQHWISTHVVRRGAHSV